MSIYRQNGEILEKTSIDQNILNAWGLNTVSVGDMVYNRVAVQIDSNHTLFNGKAAKTRFVSGFKWNSDDWSNGWTPQGITSSGDADGLTGLWDGKKFIAVSWHESDNRIRVSFADVTNPALPVYRNVLLVEPYIHATLGASFKNIPIHAGGIVWYKNWLYVMDTYNGIRVFDISQIKEPTVLGTTTIGKVSSGYAAQGYEYILPQVARYTPVAPFGMRWSFCGLDQSSGETPRLVVGEYDTAASATSPCKMYWWDLDSTTGELVLASGQAEASEKAFVTIPYLQGVHSMRSGTPLVTTLFVTSTQNDSIIKSVLDGAGTDTLFTWPNNPEGLTYFPTSDELWCVQELSGQRIVFCVYRSSL